MIDDKKIMGISVSIIVPAFNEEASITETIESAIYFFNNHKEINYDIIVCDDGSTDNTYYIVKDLEKKYKTVKLVKNDRNKGMGAAIKNGVFNSDKDFVYIHPADNQFDIGYCLEMLRKADNNDVVIGSRPIKDQTYSKFRIFLSNYQYYLIKMLLNVNLNYNSGANLYRREVFKKTSLLFNSYVMNIEIVIKASFLKYKITSLLVTCRERKYGASKMLNIYIFMRTFFEFTSLFAYITIWRLLKDH